MWNFTSQTVFHSKQTSIGRRMIFTRAQHTTLRAGEHIDNNVWIEWKAATYRFLVDYHVFGFFR